MRDGANGNVQLVVDAPLSVAAVPIAVQGNTGKPSRESKAQAPDRGHCYHHPDRPAEPPGQRYAAVRHEDRELDDSHGQDVLHLRKPAGLDRGSS